MFNNRTTNRKINRLHERYLRIIYNGKQSYFEDFLEKDGSVSIHDRNIQYLVVEMYKVSDRLSPPLISNIFKHKNSHQYNLKIVFHGTEIMSYLGPIIRDILPVLLTKNYLV